MNIASELMIHLSALLSETESAAIDRYDDVVKSKVRRVSVTGQNLFDPRISFRKVLLAQLIEGY